MVEGDRKNRKTRERVSLPFGLFLIFFITIMAYLTAYIGVDLVLANPGFFRHTAPGIVSALAAFLILIRWLQDRHDGEPRVHPDALDYEDPALIEYYGLTESLTATGFEERIRQSGQKGEAEVVYSLSWLPDDFEVYHHVLVSDGQRVQQIDHIVVGPNTLYHIETKNHGGDIVISPDGNWTITRRQNGQRVTEGMENPLEQLQRHHAVLEQWLENEGLRNHVPVEGLLVISNHRATLKGSEYVDVPVVRKDRLVHWLTNRQGQMIPIEKRQRLLASLEKLKA